MPVLSFEESKSNPSISDLKGWWQFYLACFLYIILFTFRLEDYPIYYFCDEVFPTLTGVELYKNGLKNSYGTFLPLYFDAAAGRWTPVLTVYFYGLAALLGGNSIFLSRTVAVLLSLLAPIGCAFTLRYVFKVRLWWLAIPFFALAPGWITHARTVFEAVTMTSFFSLFILFYLLSRTRSHWYLALAGLFAAAAFYTYSNGQVVVVCTIITTLLTSIYFYIKNWRSTLIAFLLGMVLCIPLINFRLQHGAKLEEHLKTVDSYLVKNISIKEKLTIFKERYLAGLSPYYWFTPNERDLERHRIPTYPHISIILLPFMLVGIIYSLKYFYKIEYRLPLLALISAPVGGALVEVTILRAIVILVPIIILSVLGFNLIFNRVKSIINYNLVSALLLICSFSYTCMTLYYALWKLPTKYRDYGLYGVQYGAKQIFGDKIPYYLNKDTSSTIRVSPVWANGTDLFPRFFLNTKHRERVTLDSIERYLTRKQDIPPNNIFIFTPGDYNKAVASKKFSQIEILEILPYPSGDPGFYFLKLAYDKDVDEIFIREREARKQLLESTIKAQNFQGNVRYSVIDNGEIKNIFDGDKSSLIRGFEANPFVIEMIFDSPQSIKKIGVVSNPTRLQLQFTAFSESNQELQKASKTILRDDSNPIRQITFSEELKNIKKMRLELRDLDIIEIANIHIWEIYIN